MSTLAFAVADPYEAIAQEVCELDRPALVEQLTHFEGSFPLDFTAEYLEGTPTDRLRHILVAARWRRHMKGQSGR